jgi:GTP-binding protein EngB required for normal cell division
MDGGWALVLSAIVTAVGGIMVTLLAMVRKENKDDHAVVAGMLQHVFKSVGTVETKLDKVSDNLKEHINSHKNN